ncbi:toll/interleukin-1 receptor domain-containing adapter protein [Xyrichtys novacula]|uniref:Toll/interleukin-1 receptor domain-containing adapter protein n=1 Tax=Xyrichtys novacula TaxID=13765 RepID=A0AAV1FXU4_XYRNO|nr:toll/interleukin-1 receptor domain-containing adapter protein [Xyrichtys novacula]
MPGWFQKLRVHFLTRHEEEAKLTRTVTSSASSISASPSATTSSQTTSPCEPKQALSVLSSQERFNRKFDVLVCHSSVDSDIEEAQRLVSFLEASPCGFRCFLRGRDDSPGSAISTELYEAVQNCHVWALLITPNFLEDEWCKYMMHQALAEGPMSHRIIPLIKNLSRAQVPQELRFFFHIDLNINPHRGLTVLTQTVLKNLEELVKKSKTPQL